MEEHKAIDLVGLTHYNELVKAALNLKADKTEIPTKVSQLQNDAGYITSAPTKVSQLENDVGYITESEALALHDYATTEDINDLF